MHQTIRECQRGVKQQTILESVTGCCIEMTMIMIVIMLMVLVVIMEVSMMSMKTTMMIYKVNIITIITTEQLQVLLWNFDYGDHCIVG